MLMGGRGKFRFAARLRLCKWGFMYRRVAYVFCRRHAELKYQFMRAALLSAGVLLVACAGRNERPVAGAAPVGSLRGGAALASPWPAQSRWTCSPVARESMAEFCGSTVMLSERCRQGFRQIAQGVRGGTNELVSECGALAPVLAQYGYISSKLGDVDEYVRDLRAIIEDKLVPPAYEWVKGLALRDIAILDRSVGRGDWGADMTAACRIMNDGHVKDLGTEFGAHPCRLLFGSSAPSAADGFSRWRNTAESCQVLKVRCGTTSAGGLAE